MSHGDVGTPSLVDVAMSTARDVLPGEWHALDEDQLQEIEEAFGTCDVPGTQEPWQPFARHHVALLQRPLGGCVPDLHDGMEPRTLESRLLLYWRCAVMLYRLPLAQLHAMLPKHHDLEVDLPPAEAPPWEHRKALVALTLPWFAQVAKTPGQVQDEEERQRKAEEEKRAKQAAPAGDGTGSAGNPVEKGATSPMESKSTSTSQKGAADHTYDRGYQKWNAFDVDKALAEEDTPPAPGSTRIVVDKDAVEEADLDAELKVKTEDLQHQYAARIRAQRLPSICHARKLQLQEGPGMRGSVSEAGQSRGTVLLRQAPVWEAHRLKEEGNRHFHAGESADAAAVYDAAIEDLLDIQENPLLSRDLRFTVEQLLLPLFNNRAAAELELERWGAAAESASKALRIDAHNVKALLRRSRARTKLEDWAGAEEDLVSGLALKPGDSTLQNALTRLQQAQPHPTLATTAPDMT
eukprot:GGOE01017884.1.p1 GENE.GGOE01017884.1~~GGOE01017884.1.p1  ORF type:complete len:465 (+),score=115.43 GGOE01017884.1:59-1453(+)